MKPLGKSTRHAEPEGSIVVKSDDGVVSYRLQFSRVGLCVQRERKYNHGHARLIHTAVFTDSAGFLRWCDADSVRFDYPIVYSAIKRKGGALLESHERPVHHDGDHEGR